MDQREEECRRRNAAIACDFKVRTLRGCASNSPNTFVINCGNDQCCLVVSSPPTDLSNYYRVHRILYNGQSMCVNQPALQPEKAILQSMTTFSL